MSLIELITLHKGYTRGKEFIPVLENLSLSIEQGEFIALMGPSGSGKTTLLNLIAGLDTPDKGTVKVDEKVLSSLKERELSEWRASHVGFVFQFYNLIPVLTAVENVALPLSLFSLSKKEQRERALFALELVGLQDRANHRPFELSGGQEQRVAIARAIVSDPTIIVADEPTGDLDRKSATEIMELLSRLNKEYQKTLIMVTHDPATAQYASRQVHMDKGALVSPL